MIFWFFVMACEKYKFTFTISTHGMLTSILIPNDRFITIRINQGLKSREFNKLFIKAIKEMKRYRKERGY